MKQSTHQRATTWGHPILTQESQGGVPAQELTQSYYTRTFSPCF